MRREPCVGEREGGSEPPAKSNAGTNLHNCQERVTCQPAPPGKYESEPGTGNATRVSVPAAPGTGWEGACEARGARRSDWERAAPGGKGARQRWEHNPKLGYSASTPPHATVRTLASQRMRA